MASQNERDRILDKLEEEIKSNKEKITTLYKTIFGPSDNIGDEIITQIKLLQSDDYFKRRFEESVQNIDIPHSFRRKLIEIFNDVLKSHMMAMENISNKIKEIKEEYKERSQIGFNWLIFIIPTLISIISLLWTIIGGR